MTGADLHVLVIDDEAPARDEVTWLLERHRDIGDVVAVDSATEALRVLQTAVVDAVFLDIQMPGLNGLELGQVLARFDPAPPLVFVSAHDQHGVAAYDLGAVDYVLKPVREERLATAVRRVLEARRQAPPEALVTVERGGVTRRISRADIGYVEAEGDYARLHTAGESYLVRVPLSTLEQEWSESFVRVHRSTLVAISHLLALTTHDGQAVVVVGDQRLPVSRRCLPAVRALLRGERPGG